MDISKTIASNLAVLMEADPALDSLKKVAASSGVGFGTVQRARNGDGNITVEKLAMIARAFGRSPADLLVPAPQTEAGATPLPARLPVRSARDERIEAITALLAKTDDYGLVAMLEKAKDVARDYPRVRQQNVS